MLPANATELPNPITSATAVSYTHLDVYKRQRQKGYKVLLIDLDGQANLTESLGFSAELPQTIYGAMKGGSANASQAKLPVGTK